MAIYFLSLALGVFDTFFFIMTKVKERVSAEAQEEAEAEDGCWPEKVWGFKKMLHLVSQVTREKHLD